MPLLEAKNIGITFGGLRAVDNFSLTIDESEVVGLIGPNGAGKTTVFNMLTGVYLPTNGDIVIDDKKVTGSKPYQIVGKGVARTFQNIRLFENLSVLENVKTAFQKEMKYGILSGVLRLPSYWREEKEIDKKGRELLALFEMEDLADVTAKNLPYGKQRKLEIARALATNPKVLMLDEPAAGMNPQETIELMETIHFIRDKFKTSILLIEHDMNLVMGICERLVVLNYGVILAQGTPEEIKNNPDVISAYLGE
ncbi:high-affinity branched-chain amino acid ABC transporter ATP-binding protein LivG [Gottschalkia purinilytica]|uniref:High-affinity branched-chain amino acid ABC transporter ATP-binding protein LivG n=1 Tax=Gottschalkia purinilytica TaxID=1503 RepID=A0A0L0WF23_GOTPU|nr:ABC transporter ATP-binding protein [Gottschalkia purinilytica]KNF10026.1 high-affinity branched-chain amino acid ABC transporter ATP-binding protein LivG [Gottschalkia purinilytica]